MDGVEVQRSGARGPRPVGPASTGWWFPALAGAVAFWLANLVISLTPVAADFRSARSIPYVPMLVEAAAGGLVTAGAVAFLLTRFPGRVPGHGPLGKALVLATLALVLLTAFVAVPATLRSDAADPGHWLLVETVINAIRILALGLGRRAGHPRENDPARPPPPGGKEGIAMTDTAERWSRGTVARWAGGLYLAYILANVLASRVGDIGLSDAEALRATITGDESRFRWGLVAALGSALLFVLTAWALYVLLRPVDEPLALLLLVLNAVGVAVQCASYLPLLAVLAQADSAVNVHALSAPQLDALALLSVSTYRVGFVMAQVFFAAWLFPLGWLVLRCGFLPRFLGWLLLVDGVAVIIWFLQVFLAPGHPAVSYPSWAVGFIAELGLALWLLVKGVKPEEPAPEGRLTAPHD